MQTADSLSMDNMEQSQVTTVEQIRNSMNNSSHEISFLSFNRQFFLSIQKLYLPDCNSQHFYRFNAVLHFTVRTLKIVLQMTTQLDER